MSFTATPTVFTLAQDFNQGGTGSGGVSNITGTLDNLTQTIITVGGSIAMLAFIIQVVRVIFTMRSGGSIGQAFSGIGIVLLGAILLGVGTALVGWFIGIGSSISG